MKKGESSDKDRLLIDRIAASNRLYTAECKIHKIATYTDDVRLHGNMFSAPFDVKVSVGDRKAIVPIDVTIKGYIDFADFSANNIVRKDSLIRIILPDPKLAITSSQIDHKGVRKFVDPLRSNFSQKEIDQIAKQAIDSIKNNANHYGIISAARVSATTFLMPLIVGMGYNESNITIEFRTDMTRNGSEQLFRSLW